MLQVDGGAGGAKQYNGFADAAMKIDQRKGVIGGLYTGLYPNNNQHCAKLNQALMRRTFGNGLMAAVKLN